MSQDKSKFKFTKDDAHLSAILSDHNASIESSIGEATSPERGYQKSNS